MRQIKRYRRITPEVRMIIPKTEGAFAPLCKNEGFRIWLWEATRIWEYKQCGNVKEEKKILIPKCSTKTCRSSEQRLKGLKDAEFEEFI